MIRFTLLLLLPLVISVIAQNGYNPSRRLLPLPVPGRPRPYRPVASVTQPSVPAATRPPVVTATQPPVVTAAQPPAVAATQPPPAVVQPVPPRPPPIKRQPLVPAVPSPPQTDSPQVPLEPKEENADYEPNPEPEPVPEPEPEPEPELEPELVADQAAQGGSELAAQPDVAPQYKPPQSSPKPSYPLKLRPQINFVVVPQPTPKPVGVKPTPAALPPLLPKPKPERKPVFGRQTPPTTQYPITVSTQRVTKAPPVIITTSITQRPGTFKQDLVCKDGNGFYAVDNECDSYIECKYNKATQRWCPDGLHFNPAAKRYEYPCAYPSVVKCNARNERQNPNPTAQCPRQYGFFSTNDGDCSKFVVCQEGVATIMDCPSGLVFNPTVQSCDWVENVPQCNPNVFNDYVCPEPPIDEYGLVSDIIYKYRYEQQCKLYIACHRGHPRLLSCESGLLFHEDSQSCIEEEYVPDCTAPRS